MLVLARRLQEKIVVIHEGVHFEITVVDLDRGRVRLAFQAPEAVTIFRAELLEDQPSVVEQ